jgi:hypothetical protein
MSRCDYLITLARLLCLEASDHTVDGIGGVGGSGGNINKTISRYTKQLEYFNRQVYNIFLNSTNEEFAVIFPYLRRELTRCGIYINAPSVSPNHKEEKSVTFLAKDDFFPQERPNSFRHQSITPASNEVRSSSSSSNSSGKVLSASSASSLSFTEWKQQWITRNTSSFSPVEWHDQADFIARFTSPQEKNIQKYIRDQTMMWKSLEQFRLFRIEMEVFFRATMQFCYGEINENQSAAAVQKTQTMQSIVTPDMDKKMISIVTPDMDKKMISSGSDQQMKLSAHHHHKGNDNTYETYHRYRMKQFEYILDSFPDMNSYQESIVYLEYLLSAFVCFFLAHTTSSMILNETSFILLMNQIHKRHQHQQQQSSSTIFLSETIFTSFESWIEVRRHQQQKQQSKAIIHSIIARWASWISRWKNQIHLKNKTIRPLSTASSQVDRTPMRGSHMGQQIKNTPTTSSSSYTKPQIKANKTTTDLDGDEEEEENDDTKFAFYSFDVEKALWELLYLKDTDYYSLFPCLAKHIPSKDIATYRLQWIVDCRNDLYKDMNSLQKALDETCNDIPSSDVDDEKNTQLWVEMIKKINYPQ